MPPGTPEHRMPQTDPWLMRRWRLHDHRHRFAINVIQAGEAIGDLSRHLGHRSVKTTEGYLEAMDRLPIAQQRGLKLERIRQGISMETEFEVWPNLEKEAPTKRSRNRGKTSTITPAPRKIRL
jgi:hypothetical protein